MLDIKLVLFYKNSYYVEKDYNEAIYWFNKSISLPYSLIELGECYGVLRFRSDHE